MKVSFPQLVRSIRSSLGDLRQEELAAKLGVSMRAVQSWEAGRKRPSPKYLKQLAALCPAHATEIAAAIKSFEWHPKRTRGVVGAAPVPGDLKKAIAAQAVRLGIDFESALRETLAAGITSLSHQSVEEFEAMIRRQAASNRRAYSRVRAQRQQPPHSKAG